MFLRVTIGKKCLEFYLFFAKFCVYPCNTFFFFNNNKIKIIKNNRAIEELYLDKISSARQGRSVTIPNM